MARQKAPLCGGKRRPYPGHYFGTQWSQTGAKAFSSTWTKPRDGELETTSECGVLGLAFLPDHAKSGRFFVYYSLKLGGQLHQRLSRFQIKAGDSEPGRRGQRAASFFAVGRGHEPQRRRPALWPGWISLRQPGRWRFRVYDKLNNARFIDKGLPRWHPAH